MKSYYYRIKNGPLHGIGQTDMDELPIHERSDISSHWGEPPSNLICPGPEYRWNTEIQSYEYNEDMSLALHKKNRKDKINELWTKEDREFNYCGRKVTINQDQFNDILAMNAIVKISNSLPQPWPGYWKDALNVKHTINTYSDWNVFVVEMVANKQQLFSKAQMLKTAIDNARTQEELDQVPIW